MCMYVRYLIREASDLFPCHEGTFMLPRNVHTAYLSGKIWEHWGSFVRLSTFKITGNAILARKVNF